MKSLMELRGWLSRWREIRSLMHQWRQQVMLLEPPTEVAAVGRLLIIPSDPWTFTGAKGDEAMMQAVVGRLRLSSPDLIVGAVVATTSASSAAKLLGFEAVLAWPEDSVAASFSVIRKFKADALIVLGADVMDGYYHPSTTVRMLILADMMARSGTKSAVLGFSFNSEPSVHVRRIFDGLTDQLTLNVRDEISIGRFRKFTRARAVLVSDSAFMLVPDLISPAVVGVQEWAQKRRDAGLTVVGFNLHPMLVKVADNKSIAALIKSAISSIDDIMKNMPVAIFLMSHDYRGKDGDDTCLMPIYQALREKMGDRLMYLTTRMSASELKGISGAMDGVVTGRMHLAIASLGMGIPVAALTYQDKFQGLFRHFDLPNHLLLSPVDAAIPQRLKAMLTRFIEEIAPLREKIAVQLPAVLEASEINLDGLKP